MNQPWQERTRPLRLECRYEFDNYAQLRDYLDAAAEVCEREGLFPDMSFGRDYVNITIHADDGSDALTDQQRRLAALLEALRAAPATD
jgi:pterin-4a-carbinolamine dehydratase